MPKVLEHCDCLRLGYGREVFEKAIERVAGIDVVEQGLDRHPGSGENLRATEAIRRGSDQWIKQAHTGILAP